MHDMFVRQTDIVDQDTYIERFEVFGEFFIEFVGVRHTLRKVCLNHFDVSVVSYTLDIRRDGP
jgi:hypothetical protein